MVSIRPDDYGMRSTSAENTSQTQETKSEQTVKKVMPDAKNLQSSDTAEINTSSEEVDPSDVERAQQLQKNKALTMREDAELEMYKDDLKNSLATEDKVEQVNVLDKIEKVEDKRLDYERCSESTQNLCGILARAIRGADVSEELEDLTPKERRIYNEVKSSLSKVSEKNRGRIPEKFILFSIKKAQGDYASYTPEEARNLVEQKMQRAALADAPEILWELKETLPSKDRVVAANQKHRADSARQNAIDLTDGFDPKTGKWRR